MFKRVALVVASLRLFLFGSSCQRCKSGEGVKPWRPNDGTGSWRIHRSRFEDEEDAICARNGWVSRHGFATALIVAALLFVVGAGINAARAADQPEKPDAWFCIKARAHRAQFASDKAAEDSARAQGATAATIAKAHRCKRQ
jgi:hypothetical protein